MNIFTTRIADYAALALAALPIVALATPTHAQNASVPYVAQSVRISDLNLASTSGQAALVLRVDTAARHFCSDERNLNARAACQAGVRAEVNEKLAGGMQVANR